MTYTCSDWDEQGQACNGDEFIYTYDTVGNLLSDGSSTYTYDAANRLKTATVNSVVYTYAYNGLGDRLQQMVGEVYTTYTLDLNAGLTQVLSGGDNAHLYGLGRIHEEASNTWAYHIPDALGSVRQLADAGANVLLAQTYEPYGDLLVSYGLAGSIYGYTGEWTDATGLVHLRARYLDTGIGRFLTKDTWGGDYNQPMSLNKWMYVNGNSIIYLDPSGNTPVTINKVLLHQEEFKENEGFILAFNLHPTTVAAGIAVQTRIPDRLYDESQLKKDPKTSELGIGPSATNKYLVYGKGGYIEKVGKRIASEEAKKYLYECFPKEKDIDLFNWDHAIKAMTLKMAASTLYCPKCDERDKLIIAGMAQNKALEWEKSYSQLYKKRKTVGYHIDWEKFFSEFSKPEWDASRGFPQSRDDWVDWTLYQQAKQFGGDWNFRYMTHRFAGNMIALIKYKPSEARFP